MCLSHKFFIIYCLDMTQKIIFLNIFLMLVDIFHYLYYKYFEIDRIDDYISQCQNIFNIKIEKKNILCL